MKRKLWINCSKILDSSKYINKEKLKILTKQLSWPFFHPIRYHCCHIALFDINFWQFSKTHRPKETEMQNLEHPKCDKRI